MDLLTQSATEQLQQLAKGKVSAAELLELTLQRIETLNPALNAVVAMDIEAARAQARASDERRRAGQVGALEGLPITIKDSYSTKGLVSTAGAPVYRDRIPEEDAASVARMRAAGAVIVGKSNVPMFTSDFQSYNPVYGTSNNPWDVSRSPGGSSGGAAAAVATGMSSLELGSDIGGSIRWPAHACGIFGLKTTFGLTSMRGHVPPPPGIDAETDLGVGGPLGRSAADLDLLLGVIAGPPDLAGVKPKLDAPRRTSPGGMHVAVWLGEPCASVDASVAAAVDQAATLLGKAGASIDRKARPSFSFEEAFEVYSLMNHAIIIAGLPAKVRDRLAAQAGEFAAGDLSHRALQSRAAILSAEDWANLNARRETMKRSWSAFFTQFDVVLMPPAPVPAIPHDHLNDIHARTISVNGEPTPYFDLIKWASLATVCHLPAAVAPILRSDEGLPAGVQIVAAEGADRQAIAVAGILETLTGGFVPPPILERSALK